MLEGRRALDFALELARTPTLATAMRTRPLPPDTLVVIRIAAGCAETTAEASALAGLASETVREAAILYLQTVLFAGKSDCYRVLGVEPGAPRRQMREHMRWLMRWLHPDRNLDEWESVFAERVLQAWREAGSLKSSRAQDGSSGNALREPAPRNRSRRIRQRWVAVPLQPENKPRSKRIKIAVALLVGAVGLAATSIPAIGPISKWFGFVQVEAEEPAR